MGYVVKLPDGTRSPLTPTPVLLDDAGDAWDRTPSSTGDYVCPVFAVRRPEPAPVAPVVGHDYQERDGLDVCARCGRVRNRGKSTPCKGALPKVETREPAPVVAAEHRPVAYRYDVAGYPPILASLRIGDVPRQTEMPLYDGAAILCAFDECAKALKEQEREHKAAVEAARREERERVAALLVAEADRLDIGCEEAGAYLRAAEIANKGQAK